MENENKNISCQTLPSLLSSFVDTFVDFSVSGGLFLPPPPPPPETSTTTLQTIFPQPTRLVAIGDLHGDLYKTKQALRLAGLIDSGDHWCGGATTLVQIGDILDRGGDEIKILYLFEKLKREAFITGGRVICMNGNHETMNVSGDFRYVTREGLEEFKEYLFWYNVGNCMKKMCHGLIGNFVDPLDGLRDSFRVSMVRSEEVLSGIRARYAMIRPDGPIATRFLSGNQTVVVVGDSIFVHGGLLPNHVEYGLERANEEISEWIRGVKGEVERDLVRGRDSMVWSRRFSSELAKDCDCAMLEHVIKTIPGVRRMIMGHTIQESGINGVCDNKAIRIDVGMSKGCGNGLPEVLEIMGNSEVRILTSNPLYKRGNESALIAEKKDGLGVLIPEMGPNQVEVKA
ncbi:hypothetical protein Leryth_018002 [Lithospermum erythrorhizon]|nr:hypothetical protein Leryth_018002 [Lithospermum erythrorhizon]